MHAHAAEIRRVPDESIIVAPDAITGCNIAVVDDLTFGERCRY